MPLTNTEIKNAKPKPNGKVNKLGDGHGLYCAITKTSKTWIYRYKRSNGKETTATFGRFPEMSLLQAREERIKARKLLNDGIDPNQYYQDRKSLSSFDSGSPTFKEIFLQWFDNNKDNWKPNYQNDIIKRCDRHIFPYIGEKSINGIDPQEMIKVFKIIESAGTIDTLNKVKGCASRVFRYAVGIGVINSNPIRDISTDIFKKKKVKHLAHITDPKEIGAMLRMISEYKGSYQVENALKIAPYVFLRPGELAGLTWNEVDLNDNLIRINANRMKMNRTHLVPLCPQVISLLKNIKHIKTGSEFVFPSLRSSSRHISPESLRAGLRRLGLTNDEMTTHGFRHMASTRLYELGFRGEVIERQLAHSERNKIKAAYNHAEYLDERKDMMNKYADYLDSLRDN